MTRIQSRSARRANAGVCVAGWACFSESCNTACVCNLQIRAGIFLCVLPENAALGESDVGIAGQGAGRAVAMQQLFCATAKITCSTPGIRIKARPDAVNLCLDRSGLSEARTGSL